MTEREMEDLLWAYPQKFVNEPLTQFERQPSSNVGRADLVFVDRIGRLLVIELKRDTLELGAITQLVDYFGMMKSRYPNKCVELMVVANWIPPERRLACEQYNVIAVEIPQKRFRDVAEEVGYIFKSETSAVENQGSRTADSAISFSVSDQHSPSRGHASPGFRSRVERGWFYWTSTVDRRYFLAFVNAKGSCSMRSFEPERGTFVRKEYKTGDYQESFDTYVKGATRLHLSRQPNLERDCKVQLPASVLLELKRQIAMSFASSKMPAPSERVSG